VAPFPAASLEELRTRILELIDYLNKMIAKPFKWTYKGRALSREHRVCSRISDQLN
jgi:hypothetical protein